MMASIKHWLSSKYRDLSPLRKVLLRVEDRLEAIEDLIARGNETSLLEQEAVKRLVAENTEQVCQEQEKLKRLIARGNERSLLEQKAVKRLVAKNAEQSLLAQEEIKRLVAQVQDQVLLAQREISAEVNRAARIAEGIDECLLPLERLGELEQYFFKRLDEVYLKQSEANALLQSLASTAQALELAVRTGSITETKGSDGSDLDD